MKIQISISAAGSSNVTKVLNAMEENPNKGRIGALLYKLPGFKLPSVRPAVTMYNFRYPGAEPVKLNEVITRASDRKLILDYLRAKKISKELLEEALPFLNWMCKQVVSKSPYFKLYATSPRAHVYLLQFLLCGNVPIPDPTLDKLIEDLDSSDDEESSDTFDPQSLEEIDVDGLKSGKYNPIEVGRVINSLVSKYVLKSPEAMEGLYKEKYKQKIAYIVRALRDVFDGGYLNVSKLELDKVCAKLRKHQGVNPETLFKKSKVVIKPGNSSLFKAPTSTIDLIDDYHSFDVDYFLSEREFLAKALEHNQAKLIPSFYTAIRDGVIKELGSRFPELATLLVLCTPKMSSALNTIIASKHPAAGVELLRVEPWLTKYVNPKILTASKIKATTDTASWVTLSAMKVKDFDTFIKTKKPVFTDDDLIHLSPKSVERIVQLLGVDESLSTVFSQVTDLPAFKQKFLSAALVEVAANVSPFGKIQKTHVMKNLEADSDAGTTLLSLSAVNKWVPSKQSPHEYLKRIMRSPDAISESIEAPSTVRSNLEPFMANVHDVDFKVIKSWNIRPSKLQRKYYSENKSDKNHYVIHDAFHGTDTSAAGAILLSGFRMSKTFIKTAQSMGSVLYMAPNIDKSLQYVGKSYGRSSTDGIIFHGDIIVKGAKGKSDASELNESTDWTFTNRFLTEEIGLSHPNVQFIVKRAYLVRRIRQHHPEKTVERATKFKPLKPLTTYTL